VAMSAFQDIQVVLLELAFTIVYCNVTTDLHLRTHSKSVAAALPCSGAQHVVEGIRQTNINQDHRH
jgi:hypothetical protein